jgi:hypothetical protein
MPALILIGGVFILFAQFDKSFYWFAAACAVALVAKIAIDHQRKIEAERRREEEQLADRRRADERYAQHRREAQIALRERLHGLVRRSTTHYHSFPMQLLLAESHLDRAELEFSARAYSPFWEQIEGALKCLGRIYDAANRIQGDAWEYEEAVGDLEGPRSAFAVSTSDLDYLKRSCLLTEQRMAGVIRKAQTDFQFSTIYEQRRTSSILIAGFQSLGDAINGLADQLSASIDKLGSRLSGLEQTFRDQHRETMLSATTIAEEASAQRAAINAEQAALATKQIAMLDNIQRHRKPLHGERGPRRW